MAGSEGGHHYSTASYWRRLVAEYTGLNFLEVAELDYLQYLIWRRDAFIHRFSQTEAGQKYLDNAWRMEQTKPDRAALRRKLGKEG
jgi:hypothetical protein